MKDRDVTWWAKTETRPVSQYLCTFFWAKPNLVVYPLADYPTIFESALSVCSMSASVL